MYHEFVLTSKHFIRTVTDIKAEWLFEIAPHFFKPDNIKDIDTKRELMKIEKDMVERFKKEEELKKIEGEKKKKSRFSFS